MHLKRLYKALAIVITVAMILPQTWVSTFAEGDVIEDPLATEAPADPTPELQVPPMIEDSGAGDDLDKGDSTGEVTTTPEGPTDIPEEPSVTPEEPSITPEEPTEGLEEPTPEPSDVPSGIPGVSETPTEMPPSTDVPPTPEETQTPSDSLIGGFGSNFNLIAAQQIVMPPITVDAYRFTTIEKVYAVATDNLIVREEQDVDSREVGKLEGGGLCYIIKDIENSEWIYIESGKVRGFLKAEYLIVGEEANAIVDAAQEDNMTFAIATLDPTENKAYAYIRETVYETKIEKAYAIANDNIQILEGTIEEDQDASEPANPRVLGELPQGGVCFVLDAKGEWLFVESDDVRGFVKADQLIVGAEAEAQLAEGSEWTEEQANELAEQEAQLSQMTSDVATDEFNKKQAEDMLTLASEDTDEETLQEIQSMITELDAKIAENKQAMDEKATLISEANAEKSGMFGKNIANAPKVNQLVAPEDNKVFYYTLTSAKEISVANAIGQAMVEFGSQFLGNPYVWGGTSLTNGADCSGFVQAIYSQFGYSLPRTSGEQSKVGMQIPVSEARTGDLIFYARNGVVYHVVMYIDNGQVLHASSSTTGIIVSGIDTAHAVWATRMISDDDQDKVDAVNAKAGTMMYGGAYTNATAADQGELLGNFKLTAYCNCAICCGKWAGGPTASGTMPVEGRTVAMAGVPFGTKLIIGGKIYTVEDRGTPYGHVDIYMNDHDECNIFGVQYTDVYAVR